MPSHVTSRHPFTYCRHLCSLSSSLSLLNLPPSLSLSLSFSLSTPDLPKVIAFANWENKTADAIACRKGGERLRGLEGANAEALLARRHRVADLYNREMEQWEHEVPTQQRGN